MFPSQTTIARATSLEIWQQKTAARKAGSSESKETRVQSEAGCDTGGIGRRSYDNLTLSRYISRAAYA